MLNKHKKIAVFIMIIIMLLFTTGSIYAYEIEDVPYVWDYLELDHILTSILRMLGNWIYWALSSILDYCYKGFTELMNFDILSLDISKKVINNMNTITYYLLFTAFIVVIVIRMFKADNQLKTLLNVCLTMMFVGIFTICLTFMSNAKTGLIQETDLIVGKGNYTIGENLLANNTVDIKSSMENGKITYLDVKQVPYFESETRMTKGELGSIIVGINEDGTYETEKVQDGLFGKGDERYYRYRTDYWNVNITLIISIFIYFLAIFKIAYLLWQWLQINIFGRVAMARGFYDFQSVGKIFASALKTLLAQIIIYFSMMLFSFLCSEIMGTSSLSNWLVKDILLFSIGMAVVVGTGFINDVLAIDDGSSFVLRSFFMAGRVSRMVKKPYNMAKGAVKTGVSVGKGLYQAGNKMGAYIQDLYNSLHNTTIPTPPLNGNYPSLPSGGNPPGLPGGNYPALPGGNPPGLPGGNYPALPGPTPPPTPPSGNSLTLPNGNNSTVPSGNSNSGLSGGNNPTPPSGNNPTAPSGNNNSGLSGGNNPTPPSNGNYPSLPSGNSNSGLPKGNNPTPPSGNYPSLPSGNNNSGLPNGNNSIPPSGNNSSSNQNDDSDDD